MAVKSTGKYYSMYMGAKVHPSTKEWFKNSKYSARDALEFFIKEVSSDPNKYKLFYLEKEVDELRASLHIKEEIVKNLREEMGIKENDNSLPDAVRLAVINVLRRYDDKKFLYKDLPEFLSTQDILVGTLANHCKLPIDKFVEVVLENSSEVKL